MFKYFRLVASIALMVVVHAQPQMAADKILAPTPPMGWNSWDSYGTTINETEFRAATDWFAEHLKPYGWQYMIVDEAWTITNPVPQGNAKDSQYTLDANGRYIPALNRFPSSANEAGFKPLADYVHSLGLKFGFHILRGIPKKAVEKNLPIAGSTFKALDAANISDTCPWNYDNYGVRDSPAGQAYYDSIASLYASWDADFIKVDCIASRPYLGAEIRMLANAIKKTGHPIVLSLSPGEAPVEKVDEMRQYSQMWRISDDVWDLWHSTVPYPQGLGDQFPRVAKWAAFTQPGHWPDSDMLPLGHLGPRPGWGESRDTRLTHDEQRTLFTLWSMFRSPLMMGGNLSMSDEWTTGLLTNPEIIAVDQHSTGERALITTDKTVVWTSRPESGNGNYVAIFNISEAPQPIHYSWSELNFSGNTLKIRDLWERKDLSAAKEINVTIPSHGCVLYRVQKQ